jgi:hypothetical protein
MDFLHCHRRLAQLNCYGSPFSSPAKKQVIFHAAVIEVPRSEQLPTICCLDAGRKMLNLPFCGK